ncbi:MAG: thioredoxin family protein [Calditrichaceae bacterium]
MGLERINETIQESPFLVAYFSYPECNVCQVLRPKVENLANKYEGVDFLYINTHEHPLVSGQHMVFAVPTIVLFSEGREIRRFSRHFSMQDLEAFLNRAVSIAS